MRPAQYYGGVAPGPAAARGDDDEQADWPCKKYYLKVRAVILSVAVVDTGPRVGAAYEQTSTLHAFTSRVGVVFDGRGRAAARRDGPTFFWFSARSTVIATAVT